MINNWKLVNGNVLSVQFRYSVLGALHKIRLYFLVEGEGNIPPMDVVQYFRNYFIGNVFSDILSEDAWWLDTTVTHLEGQCKLSENATNILSTKKDGHLDNPINMSSILRVSFTRYNQSTPLYFYIYGIRQNLHYEKMATNLLQISQTSLMVSSENKNRLFDHLKFDNLYGDLKAKGFLLFLG